MTRSGETELEMVQRHVREGQAQLARQRALLTRFPPDSDLAESARQLLVLSEQSLERHREHLARLLSQPPDDL